MNNNESQRGLHKSVINWYPGHMAKTKKEIKEVLNLIDIVYEVVDARMPISSKIVDIDDLVNDKPRILVVSKYDICDKVETDKIMKMYEKSGYKVVAVDLINGKNISSLIKVTQDMMEKENNKRRQKGLKARSARVLIVGVPNVGKSTLINKLVGRNKAGVANTPGFTKNLTWIRINKEIELLDTPGILWPKLDNQEGAHILASFSSIKEEIVNIDELAIFILKKLYELYPEKLKERYGIENLEEDFTEIYDTIGSKRGALKKGGRCDYTKVSNIIIRDLKNGYLGNITFDRLK